MKKFLMVCVIAGIMLGCKKENVIQNTQAALTGTWKSNLIIDVVYDTNSNAELSRVNYLHGLGTTITFDGKGSATSKDTDLKVTLIHDYTLRTANNKTYLTTEIVGFDQPTEYEVLGLYDTQLQLQGNVITNYTYRHTDGKDHNVYYQRTEYFTRQ